MSAGVCRVLLGSLWVWLGLLCCVEVYLVLQEVYSVLRESAGFCMGLPKSAVVS